MANCSLNLAETFRVLRKYYGPPVALPTADPFELILWENVAYLADPVRRRKAFELLKNTIGTRPQALALADHDTLERITSHGILKRTFAEKLHRCAEISMEHFNGDLSQAIRGPVESAKRALRRFPGIGEPGADKILLFTGQHPFLAPDSNGLRVLGRLGLIRQGKTYAQTYAAGRPIASELSAKPRVIQEAHLLLQQHGQTLCKRTAPKCIVCPLNLQCSYSTHP